MSHVISETEVLDVLMGLISCGAQSLGVVCSEHFLLRAMLAKVQQVDQDAHSNGVNVLRGFCLSHANPVGSVTLSEGLSCLIPLQNPGHWC